MTNAGRLEKSSLFLIDTRKAFRTIIFIIYVQSVVLLLWPVFFYRLTRFLVI